MKKAIKIFLIIGIVTRLLLLVVACVAACTTQATQTIVSYAVMMIIYVISLFIGFYALEKMKTATRADELKAIGFLTLFLFNLVAGILMLCVKDDDLNK